MILIVNTHEDVLLLKMLSSLYPQQETLSNEVRWTLLPPNLTFTWTGNNDDSRKRQDGRKDEGGPAPSLWALIGAYGFTLLYNRWTCIHTSMLIHVTSWVFYPGLPTSTKGFPTFWHDTPHSSHSLQNFNGLYGILPVDLLWALPPSPIQSGAS